MNFKPALESLTGQLAIGSLCLLGIFLIVDGRTNAFLIVEEYSNSSTWGIVAAIPVVVVTYILGVFAGQLAELAFSRLPGFRRQSDEQEFVNVCESAIEPIIERYMELKRLQKLLEGAALGFFLICLGALSEIRLMAGWESIAYISAGLALFAALLCPYFAFRIAKRAHLLVDASRQVTHARVSSIDQGAASDAPSTSSTGRR